jgi:EmrB/QacA subfamily drug resistance transporter
MGDTPATNPDRMDGGTVLALIALGISVVVLAQDFSAMNVAIPAIERTFDANLSVVQWVINAYALVFAMLIVTGGRLADQFGRKRVFLIGTALFAGFSALAGAAQNVGWLIGARALMGIGGALMWPAILGMAYAAVPTSKAGMAGGIIIGAAGVGQAIGPLVGGFLTETLSWRWVLTVNVFICALAAGTIWLRIHQPTPPSTSDRFDYAGMVTLSIGLLALLFALQQAPEWGWGDVRVIGCLVLAAGLIAAFVVVERRMGASALVPGDVMRSSQFTAACIATALIAPVIFVGPLYLPQYMQKILGFSPFNSGLGLLPLMIVGSVLSFMGGPLYDRLGAKLMVSAGALCMAIGPLLLSFVGPGAGYVALVPGMVFIGLGLGLFFSSVTTAGIQSLDPSRSSLAGGIVYMFQLAGGPIGLGLATMFVAASSNVKLAEDVRGLGPGVTPGELTALHGLLAGTETAREVAGRFGGEVAARLSQVAGDAFVAGIQNGYRVIAVLSVLGFIVALLRVGTAAKPGAPPAAKPAGD